MSNKVVLWGCGQIAEVAYFYLTNDSHYEVVGFCVDREYLKQDNFHGLPVVAFEDIEKIYPPTEYKMFISISYDRMNSVRKEKYYAAKQKGYSCISYVSSKATYYGTSVGENCFIMENNVIQPYSTIGNNVIMWSGNHLGHHSRIEDHCFIASHVVISGSTVVGEESFLGVNSTIRDNIVLGKRNLIGAGAVILRNTEDEAVFTVNKTIQINKKSTEIKHI